MQSHYCIVFPLHKVQFSSDLSHCLAHSLQLPQGIVNHNSHKKYKFLLFVVQHWWLDLVSLKSSPFLKGFSGREYFIVRCASLDYMQHQSSKTAYLGVSLIVHVYFHFSCKNSSTSRHTQTHFHFHSFLLLICHPKSTRMKRISKNMYLYLLYISLLYICIYVSQGVTQCESCKLD